MKKILDLRFDGKIEKKDKNIFNKIAENTVEDYILFIEKLSLTNYNNKFWWLSTLTSRDTIVSPVFFYMVCINYLILKKNELHKYDCILADSYEFKNILLTILSSNNITIEIKVKANKQKRYKKILSKIYDQLKIISIFIFKITFVKFLNIIFLFNVNLFKKYKLTLIDTYVSDNFYDYDRYYGDFYESITDKQKKNFFFIPTVVSTSYTKIIKILYYIKKNQSKFICKEDLLSVFDLFEILKYHKEKRNISLHNCLYKNIDVSDLIINEYFNEKRYFLIYESILTYKFIQKLKSKNFDVKCSINWFENQVIDKFWNLGFKTFYKNTVTKGYQGLIPPNLYLSQKYPTEQERLANVLPDKIIVIGKGFLESSSKFLAKKIIFPGPALRFSHIFDFKSDNNKTKFKVLVVLPASYKITKFMISAIINLEISKKVRFCFKLHPAIKLNIFNFKKELKKLYFSDKSFIQELISSDLVICNYTSSALETLACNKPLIYFNPQSNIDYISIPKEVDKNLWSISYDENDLKDQINNFLHKHNNSYFSTRNNNIINDYFIKPETKNIFNLFELL